jgi:hypothetical protein
MSSLSYRGLVVTIMANAAKDDAGFDDAHTMRTRWRKARGGADNTIHVFDPAAFNALKVVMIIVDACFVPSAGGVRQTDATDQAFLREIVCDQVDGLKGDRRQGRPHSPKDGVGVGMWMMMHKIQNRHALHCGAQPFGSQDLSPIMGM